MAATEIPRNTSTEISRGFATDFGEIHPGAAQFLRNIDGEIPAVAKLLKILGEEAIFAVVLRRPQSKRILGSPSRLMFRSVCKSRCAIVRCLARRMRTSRGFWSGGDW